MSLEELVRDSNVIIREVEWTVYRCQNCGKLTGKDCICHSCGGKALPQKVKAKRKFPHLHRYWKGKDNPMYRKKHKEETKNKIRMKRLGHKMDEKIKFKLLQKGWNRGQNNPMYGRHHTEEAKRKMVLTKIKRGVIQPHKVIRCLNCNKEFELPAWEAKNRKFCSYTCAVEYKKKNGFYIEFSLKGHKTLNQIKETKPERKVRLILERERIQFTRDYVILLDERHYTVPDFTIPDKKIAIYVDGIYWHSLPKRRRTDSYINKRLKELGWKVIRIPETEVNERWWMNKLLNYLGMKK